MARYKDTNNFIQNPQKQGSKPKKPPLKERLNKILFWVIIGLFCLFSVGSICGILAYSKDCKTVYADSVTEFYSFSGSNIWLPVKFFGMEYITEEITGEYVGTVSPGINVVPFEDVTGTTVNSSNIVNFKFSMEDVVYDGTVYTELVISKAYLFGNNYNFNTVNEYFSLLDNALYKYNTGNIGGGDIRFILPQTTDNFYVPYSYLYGSGQTDICRVLLRCHKSSADFNCNIVKLVIGNGTDFNYARSLYKNSVGVYHIRSLETNYNYLRYYDKDGNYIQFDIPCVSITNASAIEPRTYYFTTDLDNDIIYQEGYEDGYVNGEQVGQENGYQNGYNGGYQIGYNEGKNYGFEHASDYSFYSLIAAVVDAPLNAVISLFNFEILGINFSSLFTGLLTLAVIIFVVRLVL